MLGYKITTGVAEAPNSGDENAETQQRLTFDVVQNGDYVLSEQLRGAAAELSCLNQLENGPNLWIFTGQQITGQGGTEEHKKTFKAFRSSTLHNWHMCDGGHLKLGDV